MGMLSVPGKILFYGGYSVLVPGHTSLCIAVTDLWGKGVTSYFSFGKKRILSEQFGIDITPSIDGMFERNIMVEFAYVITEAYLKSKNIWKKDVTLNLVNSAIFGKIDDKSGLGSSAAAIVAVVKSLFAANDLQIRENVHQIHKLSQLINAIFTKKASSGFDIATCSYDTSIIYNRYDENFLSNVSQLSSIQDLKSAFSIIDVEWSGLKVQQFIFPLDIGILFFNIKGRMTDTLTSVRMVFEWKKENNETFIKLMQSQNLAEQKAIECLKQGDYNGVRKHTHDARAVHRELQGIVSSSAGYEISIEPREVTQLIDFVEANIQGIIAGRAPGAGGWDGLAFLVKKGNLEEAIIKITEKAKECGLELDYVPLRIL